MKPVITRTQGSFQREGARWRAALTGTFVALLTLSACAQTPENTGAETTGQVKGRWITESGNLEVEIAPCGAMLCGTVVKVLNNRSMGDSNSEMKAVDSRPALGMTILSDFTAAGDGEWKGNIYNRENGKTYRCILAPLSSDELKVRGYVGLPLFGKTQVWRRVGAMTQS